LTARFHLGAAPHYFEPDAIVMTHAVSRAARLSRIVRLVAACALLVYAAGVNTRAEAAGDARVGAKIFAQRCARCHGGSGKGDGPDLAKIHADNNPDDWTNRETNAELSDYKIRKIVTGGGPAVDKSSKMPAFGGKVSPAQIGDLIAFIRTLPK
jgi:mono/diheme cytochrome c family protein